MQAPSSGGAYLPVRAIADGKVTFVHAPTLPNSDIKHALNYNPCLADTPTAAWTSDGFVVIEHKTEIRAEGNVVTEVASPRLHASRQHRALSEDEGRRGGRRCDLPQG